MKEEITIVIPLRSHPQDDADITLWSLQDSSFKNYSVILVPDQGRGANWARNKGLGMVNTKYVLFSDNDIKWQARGIEWLLDELKRDPKASYAYGVWEDLRDKEKWILSEEEFDPAELRKRNYISTMSLFVTENIKRVSGFDPKIHRLQDWDLYLTMWEHDMYGVNCGKVIFTTESGGGITSEENFPYEKAKKAVLDKHKLK